jgi:general secretion pathway protein D
MGPGARKNLAFAVLLVTLVGGPGCAARRAYRQGQREAKKGNWDLAVARLTKALDKAPANIGYKLALENARVKASRYHYDEARKSLAAGDLEQAAEELDIAVKYDASNSLAHDELAAVRERILEREEERRARAHLEEAQARGRAVRYPVPVLAPRSPVPITLQFPDQSLEKIFEALSKLSGVNILLDESFRDKRVSVKLSGVTFQEALNQISLANHLFYKVLDQNTLIIVPEAPANRRKYDDQLVQTFYLESADATETLALVKAIAGIKKGAANKALGAMTLVGTPDQLAVAARVIETNDKTLAEVVVEVEILQVRSQKLKDYGIE